MSLDPVNLSIAFVVIMNQAYGARLKQNIRILPSKQNHLLTLFAYDQTPAFKEKAVFLVLGSTPI
jgi:hypothetical protein